MNTIDPQLITALIMCGGQASRMGGQDKGLILLHNKPLVQWTIERCQLQVGHLIINANRHLDQYAGMGYPTYPDVINDYRGPLAGFQVGLTHATTPYVLMLPCDTPLFPHHLVSRFAEVMAGSAVDCVYATTSEQGQIQAHPVFCLLKTTTLASLQQFLASGQRKIDKWFASLPHRAVHFEDANAFLNINTPEELDQIDHLLP